MNFRLSNHAIEEMERRGISREMLWYMLANPQQVIAERDEKRRINRKLILAGVECSCCVRL